MPGQQMHKYLMRMVDEFESENPKHLSVKFDGAPSILVGRDPADGKIFVATKSLFNVTPILYKSLDELQQVQKQDLRDTLWYALSALEDYEFNGLIFQGDVLWTKDDFHGVSIERSVFVGKNIIKYKINDFLILSAVQNSDIGIVWHTAYRGKSIQELEFANLSSIAISEIAPFVPYRLVGINPRYRRNHVKCEKVANIVSDIHSIKYFDNDFPFPEIAQKLFPRISSSANLPIQVQFENLVTEHFAKEADKFSTAIAKKERIASGKTILEYKSWVSETYLYYSKVASIKRDILNSYFSFGKFLPHFYETTTDGYYETKHEGFVYYDAETMQYCKLVDRDVFSALNRLYSPFSK